MKHIKLFEEYKKFVLGTSKTEDGWRILQLSNEKELDDMFNNFYIGKEWIDKDGDFDVYFFEDKDYDKDEEEYFWHKKIAILVDWKHYIIKTKEILSEPLYNIRDKKLTRPQELSIRMWIGTDKKPKHNKFKGEYFGMEGEYALVRSPLSGNIIKIDKNGENIIN